MIIAASPAGGCGPRSSAGCCRAPGRRGGLGRRRGRGSSARGGARSPRSERRGRSGVGHSRQAREREDARAVRVHSSLGDGGGKEVGAQWGRLPPSWRPPPISSVSLSRPPGARVPRSRSTSGWVLRKSTPAWKSSTRMAGLSMKRGSPVLSPKRGASKARVIQPCSARSWAAGPEACTSGWGESRCDAPKGIAVDADSGQGGHFLAAQSRRAAQPAAGRQPRILGGHLGAPGPEGSPQFTAPVHALFLAPRTCQSRSAATLKHGWRGAVSHHAMPLRCQGPEGAGGAGWGELSGSTDDPGVAIQLRSRARASADGVPGSAR